MMLRARWDHHISQHNQSFLRKKVSNSSNPARGIHESRTECIHMWTYTSCKKDENSAIRIQKLTGDRVVTRLVRNRKPRWCCTNITRWCITMCLTLSHTLVCKWAGNRSRNSKNQNDKPVWNWGWKTGFETGSKILGTGCCLFFLSFFLS